VAAIWRINGESIGLSAAKQPANVGSHRRQLAAKLGVAAAYGNGVGISGVRQKTHLHGGASRLAVMARISKRNKSISGVAAAWRRCRRRRRRRLGSWRGGWARQAVA
jgi:hypothetical protein